MPIIQSVAVKSLIFSITVFFLSVLLIKFSNSGQVGYGAHTRINGSQITVLGYMEILKWSTLIGSMVFISAAITSTYHNLRIINDRFI